MNLFGVSLGQGNSKVGEVFTFSLPSIETCPGASRWCLDHCYADRYEKIRPGCRKAYRGNLRLAQNSDAFRHTMIGILPRIMPCMRLHVSGDFSDAAYIAAWEAICRAFPQTRFWSYSRSYTVPKLLGPLERLASLKNVNLFASTDPTMPLPPNGWRVAFIDSDPRAKGILCPEQTGQVASCLDCGYCFQRNQGHVIFRVH